MASLIGGEGFVTKAACLMEGEWSCQRGGHMYILLYSMVNHIVLFLVYSISYF